MSWPGHDDAPHFQIPWAGHPRLKAAIDRLAGWARRNRRMVVVFLAAAVIAALVSFGPTIKASIVRTVERVGQSAAVQGRAFPDLTQKSAQR